MKKTLLFILTFGCIICFSACNDASTDSSLGKEETEAQESVYVAEIIVKETESTPETADTFFYRNDLYKYRLKDIASSNVEVRYSDGTVKLLEEAFEAGDVTLDDLEEHDIPYRKDYLFSIYNQLIHDSGISGKDIEIEEKKEVFYENDEYSYFFDTTISQYIILEYKSGRKENAVEALQSGKITLEDFIYFDIGYYTLAKNIAPGTEKTVDHITDEATFVTCATENFYQDDEYVYYFSSGRSYGVFVYYIDGTRENICPALESGRAKITDLNRFKISYSKYEVGGSMFP